MTASGNELSRVLSSMRKLLRGLETTTIYRIMGCVIKTKWYSKVEGDRLIRGNRAFPGG